MPGYDVAIAGAGLIGLTLALELQASGSRVVVLDTAQAMRQTSSAAAGMLAVDDPHNPPALHPLARYSVSCYPAFLSRLEDLSGFQVPWQTSITFQHQADGATLRLAENSLDPRQLADAVLAAVHRSPLTLIENVGGLVVDELSTHLRLRPFNGPEIVAGCLVHATGAWFSEWPRSGPRAVVPRKGQMLRVRIPSGLALTEVHRSEALYVVPRTRGPQAGTALIGATDEDAGFDLTVHQPDLDRLRARAAHLLPALASAEAAPQVEAWAGLRPATADLLPLLGPLPHSSLQWAATGHYRNGILLAPGTARVLADAIQGKPPAVDLLPFSPARF